MPTIEAIHGRARVRRATRRCRQLVVVLLATFVVLKLEQLVRIQVAGAARVHHRYDLAWLSLWAQLGAITVSAAAYTIGGTLVDGFGLRRVVALLLIGWCEFVLLGGIADPASYALLGPLATSFLPGIILVAALTAVRLTMAARRRGPAIALLFIAVENAWSSRYPVDLYVSLFGRTSVGDPTHGQYPMFALATAGTAVAAVWLLAFPEVDTEAGIDRRAPNDRPWGVVASDAARLLGDARVWGLVAIQSLNMFVSFHALDQFWTFELARLGVVKTSVLLTIVTIPLASLVFAGWSDWLFRRTRSFLQARRPFIVLGFLVGGGAPLLAASVAKFELQLTLIAALGLGAMRVADLAIVDLAPRPMAGGYIGVVLTGLSVLGGISSTIVFEFIPSPLLPATVAILALAGAAASALLLPRMRVPDDVARERALSQHF